MRKEGWCVGLGQELVSWGLGACLKYLKKGVGQKIGEGKQRFLKAGGGGGWKGKLGTLKKLG